jgi:hypothetical protein
MRNWAIRKKARFIESLQKPEEIFPADPETTAADFLKRGPVLFERFVKVDEFGPAPVAEIPFGALIGPAVRAGDKLLTPRRNKDRFFPL